MKRTLALGREEGVLAAAALALLLIVVLQPASPFENLADFLPLHTFMETFALVVACLIFGVGWHSYSKDRPGNVAVLACAFLGVGLLDFAHTLSYKGMPDFVTPASVNKGVFFWLAGRLLAAAALLVVAFNPWRPMSRPYARYLLLLASLGYTSTAYWLGLHHLSWVPAMFVEGQGLTAFKVMVEYSIMALLVGAAWGFRRAPAAKFDNRGLFAAAGLMVLSELCFTLYAHVSDTFNLFGHLYKVIAYCALYRTVFVGSVRAPYVRLAASRQEVWREKERAQITLRSIGDAVIISDADGRVEAMNAVAETLTGWSLAEAQGRPLQDLFGWAGDGVDAAPENPLARWLRERHACVLAADASLTGAEGQAVPVEGTVAPMADSEGALVGSVLVLRDIRERKQAEQRIQALNQELEERVAQRTAQLQAINQELEAFSYSVSHDLRTPLRAINGFSQLLQAQQGEVLDAKGRDYLRRILAASRRMDDLIAGLLELARLGRGELHRTRCDLTSMAHSIADGLRQSAPEWAVEFAIGYDMHAYGDERLLRVLLENLMGNAWKFTRDTAGARIEVGACEVEGQGVYYVRDNGVGFRQEHAERLFAPFQRLHEDSQFEGSGIGLATAQRIVQRHGGTIWAQGELGAGAVFYFQLKPAGLGNAI